jgi:2-methylcitrate dehydratase PrpD
MLGTVAALAAQRGLTGDPSILDGPYGYWQMYGSPFFKDDVFVGDLGRIWYSQRSNFKFYPCCYFDVTSISALRRLVRENKIEPEDIDEIVVYGDRMMLTPNRWPTDIRTNEDAQFSHAYLFALAACTKDKAGPHWQLPASLTDNRIKSLMPKVKVKVHPDEGQLMAEKVKAGLSPVFLNVIVEVLAHGRKYITEEATPKGSVSNPMTAAELIDKFRRNASYSLLKQSKVDPIIETIWNLDKLENVTELTRLLVINSANSLGKAL